jgi:hypothetical protein
MVISFRIVRNDLITSSIQPRQKDSMGKKSSDSKAANKLAKKEKQATKVSQ